MRKKAKIYASLLVEILKKTPEKELPHKIRKFKILLKKRGDFKNASTIVQEFQKMWEESKGKVGKVVMAGVLPDRALRDVKHSLQKQGFLYQEEINPKVIGGMALFLGKEFLIDGTIKTKLNTIAKLLHG